MVLGAKPDFADLAGQYGVEFAPLGNPFKPLMTDGAKNIESGNHIKIFLYMYRRRKQIAENFLEDAYRAAAGSDAIIYKYTWSAGYILAEKLNIPCAAVMFFPITPTVEFPCFTIGKGKDRGRLLNALFMHIGGLYYSWRYQHADIEKFRRERLGLKPMSYIGSYRRMINDKMPVFYAYSPYVLPKPSDWPERMHVTGIWPSPPPPGWKPPAELTAFLDSGPAPVYIGFGSMTSDADRTLELVLEALEIAGKRGVILSGWSGIGDGVKELPETVYCADEIFHHWLFPKMAAVVHHGGAGTTASGLASGVPSIITPFTLDQFSWGGRVRALGAGPEPIPFKDLTASRLAAAIAEATTDTAMRKRAREIGEILKREDGLHNTIKLFVDYCENERNGK